MKFSLCRRWSGVTFFALALLVPAVSARTLRLFVIGNSFSKNATHYLPQLAAAGGHDLILKTAQTGGCSLERHWKAAAAGMADPADPAANIYGGHSLRELLGTETWDVITLQQYSLLSGDPSTYRPFGGQLRSYLKTLQPQAEFVVHQTWAYRTDASRFSQTASDQFAPDARRMWEASRAAYRQFAHDLGARLMPVGDAFWAIASDPAWCFQSDPDFNPKTAVAPALPREAHSLHVGYHWKAEAIALDANHANVAGEYLGALVWYGVLFGESPARLGFVPDGLAPDFAAHLRQVAADAVTAIAPFNRDVTMAKILVTPASVRE